MDTYSSAKTKLLPTAADLRSLGPLALCRHALEKVDAEGLPPEIGARLAEIVRMLEQNATD